MKLCVFSFFMNKIIGFAMLDAFFDGEWCGDVLERLRVLFGTFWLQEPVNVTLLCVWLFVFTVSSVQIHKIVKRKSKGKLLYNGEAENLRFFRMIRTWATILLLVDVAWSIYMFFK